MDLRKKILNLEEGLDIYSQLLQDEETILIPFAISQYVTVSRIDELLPEYLADLRRNECKEALCIDLDQMTNVDYWMKKLVKLRSDMERLGTVPMKEHGFVVTILGFSPETTMDLYRAIEQKVMQMVEMLTEVQRILTDAPAGLYENFYLSQKAAVDAKPVKARYRQWKREVGVATSELLKDKEMQELVGILTKKVMRHAQSPSNREIEQVDLNALEQHMVRGYEFPSEFPNCYARFCRFVQGDGDTLQINYDCYGKYLHESYYKLTPDERRALIEFDIMLDLIHKDIFSLKGLNLPDDLNTPEAINLLEKARQAGYLNDQYQPLISKTKSAMLADEIATRLNIRNRWKVFEQFWNRHDMYKDNYEGRDQKQSDAFLESIRKMFD